MKVEMEVKMKVEVDVRTIGDYLRYKMQERRKGVRDVAVEVGMSSATVSRITAGKGFNIRLLVPLATWLGLTPQELWDLLEGEY